MRPSILALGCVVSAMLCSSVVATKTCSSQSGKSVELQTAKVDGIQLGESVSSFRDFEALGESVRIRGATYVLADQNVVIEVSGSFLEIGETRLPKGFWLRQNLLLALGQPLQIKTEHAREIRTYSVKSLQGNEFLHVRSESWLGLFEVIDYTLSRSVEF